MSIYYAGTIVERKKAGVIDHPGVIVFHRGQVMVVHNTPFKGVILSTLAEYANGQDVIVSEKYKALLPAPVVAENAMRLLGNKWLPLFNCQHFVTLVGGHDPHSPGLISCISILGVLIISAALLRG